MTEEEAKAKWCPFARTPNYEPQVQGSNRNLKGEPLSGASCIGSACMAWRVSDRKLFRHEELEQTQMPGGDGWYAINTRPSIGPMRWLRDVPIGDEGGYCGLAGAPQ